VGGSNRRLTGHRGNPGGRIAALLVAASVLAACATQRGVNLPDISAWDRRTAVLGALDHFEFSGRIGVKYADDGFNGKFRWQQAGAGFDARVSGPLGIGTVLIEGDGQAVEVTDNDGVTTILTDVEADLYQRYGWTIPVDSLRYWALGIPDPRVPAETVFGPAGELTELRQRGWTVAVGGYRDAGGGQQMPARLTAENPGTRVRLVIDRWTFREASGA
jgi:outer membrane lipoprotein LolB